MKSQIPQRGGVMPARNALDAMMFSGTNFHIFFIFQVKKLVLF